MNKFFIFLLFLRSCFQQDTFDNLYLLTKQLLRESLNQSLTEITSNKSAISQECFSKINNFYFNSNNNKSISDKYIEHSLRFSSKTFSDLSNFDKCTNQNTNNQDSDPEFDSDKIEIEKDFQYIVIIVSFRSQGNINPILLDYSHKIFLIGNCVIKYCNESEYKLIFKEMTKNLDILQEELDSEKIYLYSLDKKEIPLKSIILTLSTEGIILFFFLFSIVRIIPENLFYFCFLKKPYGLKEKIRECFDLRKNSKEILQRANDSDSSFNDTSLKIFRGIRGCVIILLIASRVFLHIFNYPNKMFAPSKFKNKAASIVFPICIFGKKYGSQILYGISGFVLLFKMIYFLDLELEEDNIYRKSRNEKLFFGSEEDNNLEEDNEKEANSNRFLDLNEMEDVTMSLVEGDTYETSRRKLSFFLLLKFQCRYLYKYLIYICSFLFFRFCLIYSPFLFSSKAKPLWLYCEKEIIEKITSIQIISHLLLFSSVSNSTYIKFDPFSVLTNEIIFFIFSSFFIFLCYKKNWRLDSFLVSFLSLLLVGKYMFYSIFNKNKDDNDKFYPSLIYQENKNSFITSNPLYNYSSFIIGMLFALVHYCIQNHNKDLAPRVFLNIPGKIAKVLVKFNFIKFVMLALSVIGFILIAFSTCIFMNILYKNINIYEKELVDEYFLNKKINLFSLFDSDAIVLFLFLFITTLLLLGGGAGSLFLESEYWNGISRPYWTFLIVNESICYYVFYMCENKIGVDIKNVYFYSCIVFVYYYLFGSLIFIFIEVPLKKLNKLFLFPERESRIKNE